LFGTERCGREKKPLDRTHGGTGEGEEGGGQEKGKTPEVVHDKKKKALDNSKETSS